MYELSEKVLGKSITNSILKASFFGHFCAGEDAVSIQPTVKRLQEYGVGSILDYAAEADVASHAKRDDVAAEHRPKLQARTYDYEGEASCDANADITISAIKVCLVYNYNYVFFFI
jgi:proline dehydrogenase